MAKLTQREFFEQLLTRKELTLVDFEYLASFKSLHTIHLAKGCKFPDDAFKLLKDAVVVRSKESYISCDNFNAIMQFQSLEGLEFNRCEGISDEEVERICSHTKLKGLSLAKTKISDASLRFIAELESLIGLNISETSIKGSSLYLIARLKNLETLSINGLDVSDSDILPLSSLSKLDYLHTADTSITEAGKHTFLLAQLGALQPPDSSTLEQVTEVLAHFFAEMKQWEAEGLSEENRFSEEALLKLKEILARYCTNRSRQDIGFGHRYGQAVFHDFGQLEIVASDMPNKQKLVLYVKEWRAYFRQFVFIKKSGRWLIDLKKMRDKGRWISIHPQL